MPIQKQELSTGVDLWWDHVDNGTVSDELPQELSADERVRASRFRSHQDRSRFVSRRVLVRHVLSSYTGVAAGRIRFRESAWGKPELDPPLGVSFNTSHSNGLAVVAVTHERAVGVDIERVREMADAMEVAERYFSDAEVEYLRSVPEASLAVAFLTIWTRKESYAKAIGTGLSMPLREFDVSTPGDDATGRPRGARGYSSFTFTSLDTLSGYAAAVTVADAGAVAART